MQNGTILAKNRIQYPAEKEMHNMRKMISKIKAIQIRGRTGKFLVIGLSLLCLINALFVPAAYAAGPGQVTLAVNQIFSVGGSSAPPSEIFAYRLEPKSASNPMPEGSGPDRYTFTVAGTKAARIGPISFREAGTYIYELNCVAGTDAGYTYDRQVYTIEIHVRDDLTVISIVYMSDGVKASDIVFAHAYGTLPSDPSRMVDPPVEKTVSGNPKTASLFVFRLTAENLSNPMPDGSVKGVKSIQITGSGRGVFGTWSYTRGDVYRYTVSEVNAGIKGYTYDTTVYTITDTVEAVDGQLAVTRIITDSAGRQVTSLPFVNAYKASTGGGDNPLTGDSSNPALWITLLAISGILVLFIALSGRKPKHHSDPPKPHSFQ